MNYSLSLATGDNPLTLLNGVANPVSVAPVVPLPPAAPITLLMLAGMGAAGYLRCRAGRRLRHSIS